MYFVLISILTIEFSNEKVNSINVVSELQLTKLAEKHKLLSIQLLFHVLSIFIQTYLNNNSLQSKLLFPILTGLYYIFSHPSLLSFTTETTYVFPISQSDFMENIRSFLSSIETIDWQSFSFDDKTKRLVSYNNTSFPETVTLINSVKSLSSLNVCRFLLVIHW